MTSSESFENPDPTRATGLEQGGAVPSGETPPMSGSTSGAAPEPGPNHGPVSGNRTPMVVTLTLLGVILLLCAGLVIASLVAS